MSPDRFFVVQFLVFLIWAAALLWVPFFRPPPPAPPPPPPKTGSWSGVARSATTGLPVPGVRFEVRAGQQQPHTLGTPQTPGTAAIVQRGPASSTGAFAVRALEGLYTVRFDAPGYVPEARVISLKAAGLVRDIFLVPKVPEGHLRVRLTWAERPADLDLHFVGPMTGGPRMHVCFRSKTAMGPNNATVHLDRDDLDSFGPETLTVPLSAGTFRVYVHDYTNRAATAPPGSTALSRSEAVVDVYSSAGRVGQYTVSPTAVGNLWTVLDLEGPAGTVTPINTYASEDNVVDIRDR